MKKALARSSRAARQNFESYQSRRSLPGPSRKRSPSSDNHSANAVKRTRSYFPSLDDDDEDDMARIQMENIQSNKPDNYCWVCHKLISAEDDSKFRCCDCIRSYHSGCIKKIKINQNKPLCECKWTTVDGSPSEFEYPFLKELLKCAFSAILTENKCKGKEHNADVKMFNLHFKNWPSYEKNSLLREIMDFIVIVDKIMDKKYKSIGEFFQDIKWIHHNSCIVSSDPKFTAAAQKLEKVFKQELSYAEGCAECYIKTFEECFSSVCSYNHPIVWAKLKGFPYWPAKCLRLKNNLADVRFFGTHDKSLIPLSQIYKISTKNPGATPKNSKRKTGYEQAMEELSDYINLYEMNYGRFQYFPHKTPLLQTKISQNKKRQSRNKDHNDASLSTDDLTETQAPFMQPPFTKNNLSEEVNETDNVFCQMTFIEESPVEANASDEAMEPASVIYTPFQDSQNFIKGSEELNVDMPIFQAPQSNTETAQTASNISCSTSSPLLITSTQSLINIPSNMEDDEIQVIHDNHSKFREVARNISEDLSQLFGSPNSEDVDLLSDAAGNKLATDLLNNPQLGKTYLELILHASPGLRKFWQQCGNMHTNFILLTMAEVNKAKATYMMDLNKYVSLMCSRITSLTEDKDKLKTELEELKKKTDEYLENSRTRATLREQMNEIRNSRSARHVDLLKKLILKLRQDLEQSKISKASTLSIQKKINEELSHEKINLQNKVKENEDLTKEREKEIEELKFQNEKHKQRILELKDYIQEIRRFMADKEENKHDIESQTDIRPESNAPEIFSSNLGSPIQHIQQLQSLGNSQYDVECQTDIQSESEESSIEHIISQKTHMTNFQVVEFTDGTVERHHSYSSNTIVQNQQVEFPQPSQHEFPQPSQHEFPQPSQHEFPQPSQHEFPQPSQPEFPEQSQQAFAQPFVSLSSMPTTFFIPQCIMGSPLPGPSSSVEQNQNSDVMQQNQNADIIQNTILDSDNKEPNEKTSVNTKKTLKKTFSRRKPK